MSDAWLRILRGAGTHLGFSAGPTFPFLLGAQRHPIGSIASPEASKAELHALLLAMRDDLPGPESVAIFWCSEIDTPVASVRPSPPEGRGHIDSPKHAGRALYYGPIRGYRVFNLESMTEVLWAIHQDEICSGCFSRRGRAWGKFDPVELESIRAMLDGHDD